MAGHHTITETERQVDARLGDLKIDFDSMAAISNIFRAANSVRNHLERTALSKYDLTWTGFVVLWVVWVWEPIETRDIAEEAGISKATLTGVLNTLEGRGWLVRERGTEDKRQMFVSLTPEGRKLMKKVFPAFNKQEQKVTQALSTAEKNKVAALLRAICQSCE